MPLNKETKPNQTNQQYRNSITKKKITTLAAKNKMALPDSTA